MRIAAFRMAFAKKWADGEILVVDAARLPEGKTRAASKALQALSGIAGFEKLAQKNTGIIIGAEDQTTVKAFRNIPGIRTMEARNLTALDVLGAKFMILGKDAALAAAGKK